MKKFYSILVLAMLICFSCDWQLKPAGDASADAEVVIERYDRIENLYLTTGDYSALQQMNTDYPMQTRMLIEDMLRIGKVNDPEINTKFLHFFQDSTLQMLLADVQEEFADISDLNSELSKVFSRLREDFPKVEIPQVYTQVGSFDQSVVVGNGTLGISLDKYLGADYPFYQSHYTPGQRQMMVRSMIVPDCLAFYLLSLYPIPSDYQDSPLDRDRHMGKIQWVVNRLTGRQVFTNEFVTYVDSQMKRNKHLTIDQMLRQENK